ncbi:MAG TPA: TatD family hydrolase [Flavitalea sp.]|nr:TatD family hydrolase [Flavitalea sp.]
MENIQLIDTHCHLYLEEFRADLPEVLDKAVKAGIFKVYMPALDKAHYQALIDMELSSNGLCKAMAGLHPCYVKDNVEKELQAIRQWTNERSFSAIGEIGLDYYWDKTFIAEQKMAFESQMELAASLGLPVVIHSRESMRDTIDMLKGRKGKGLTGIFHCFSGTLSDAREIIECGLKLGIGGVLTYKKAGLAEVIAEIELEHLVLETDAPYLSPVPFRGKRNEPSYIRHVADKLAQLKNLPLAEVARVTTANAQNIFGT